MAAWYNRGINLMHGERLNDALAFFTSAGEIYLSDAKAHHHRGLTKVNLGDRDVPAADFRRALQIEPSLAEAGANLKRLFIGPPNPR